MIIQGFVANSRGDIEDPLPVDLVPVVVISAVSSQPRVTRSLTLTHTYSRPSRLLS